MAAATITTILDRIQDINETISGVHTRRYFPNSFDTAKLPLLTPWFQTGRRTRLYEASRRVTRTFLISAIVGEFMRGLPTQSAVSTSEAVVELIEAAYDVRDRLVLNEDILTGLISAQLGDDTGIRNEEGLAVIDFPLIVIYDRDLMLL